MTIDEAIKIEKHYGKKDKKALEKLQEDFPMIEGIMDNNLHEQLAEWLEELKIYKECNISKANFSMGYNKAIDDFAEALKKYYQCYDIDLCLQDNDHFSYTDSFLALESYIDEIAQQLKAGGIDG